jgi:hypothetical protein
MCQAKYSCLYLFDHLQSEWKKEHFCVKKEPFLLIFLAKVPLMVEHVCVHVCETIQLPVTSSHTSSQNPQMKETYYYRNLFF